MNWLGLQHEVHFMSNHYRSQRLYTVFNHSTTHQTDGVAHP